uniref:F-box domain-containing protein n=1 Tax=Gigaspora margarita TaxID=4874 RepID=A0A8H3WXZ2_GIGMA
MASKIFMGDIPELMENILKILINNSYSLYSCILVSRHWCKISIPILWQDPFSFKRRPLFISRYFSSLEDERVLLELCEINAKFSKTIFEYASFLKALDLSCLERTVKEWINLMLVDYYGQSIYSVIVIY